MSLPKKLAHDLVPRVSSSLKVALSGSQSVSVMSDSLARFYDLDQGPLTIGECRLPSRYRRCSGYIFTRTGQEIAAMYGSLARLQSVGVAAHRATI